MLRVTTTQKVKTLLVTIPVFVTPCLLLSHITLSSITKGEGWLQGGWILFDPNGTPKAAFQENAKMRVPIDDILKEVQSMQGE